MSEINEKLIVFEDLIGSEMLDRIYDDTVQDFRKVVQNCGLDPITDLVEFDFSDCDLTGADFRLCDLRGCNFQGADLTGVQFDFANLTGTYFSDSDIEESSVALAVFEENDGDYDSVFFERKRDKKFFNDAVTALSAAFDEHASWSAAHAALSVLCEIVSCNHYVYIGGNLDANGRFAGFDRDDPHSQKVILTDVSKQNYLQYSTKFVDQTDPVLKMALSTTLPKKLSEVRQYADRDVERKMLEIARASNVREGMVFPLNPPGDEFGILALLTSESELPPDMMQLVPWVIYFAQNLHIWSREECLRNKEETLKLNMTPLEVEVLQLLSEGKTKVEISEETEISVDKVSSAIKSARSKLDAFNTTNAVARIMTIRLKEPF